VLFPTDFSTVASQVVPILEHLVPSGLSEVTLLHALEVLDAYPPAISAPAEAAARGFVEALAQRLQAAGVSRVHSHISRGHPIPMILDVLNTGDFSLVVMGTQGRSLLSEILLGSVAYHVARLAPCPAFLIPKEAFGG
jgi:nucleotide-binding universal stress UspA family protein